MRHLVQQFLDQQLSRRGFIEGLTAMGITAAGVSTIVRATEAAENGLPKTARRMTGTGGELMIAQMKAADVRFLFTNPGSMEVGFFDAFVGQKDMQLIMGLHEGIVIAMADGFHKASGKPGFVNVHVIAGSAQASGQLYNSSRDGSALVVTAGLIDNEIFSDDLVLGPRPGFNQKDVNRQFMKFSWESHDAAGLPMMLRRAFKVATTEPGGPVYLAVPNYVMEKPDVSADIYDHHHFMIPSEVSPNPEQVVEVAKLLLSAKNPQLYLGDEVAKAGAQAEALELAELLALQVREGGMTAYRSFPRTHQLFGGGGQRDLLVNVGGADMGGSTVPANSLHKQYGKIVRMGLNTNGIGRNHAFDIAMVGHAKSSLRALIDCVQGMVTQDRIKKICASRPASGGGLPKFSAKRAGMAPMHPDELGWTLDQELDKDAIVVSENLSGSNNFYSCGFRDNEKQWIGNSGAGLGWGIGASTGVKLAQPDRQVVCNIGDGALMYSAAGFWTQARYEVPVLTVVCNNHNYQTVRNAYHRYNRNMKATNQYAGMYLGDPNIDFAGLAKSQGGDGEQVTRSADLKAAIRRGIAATREGRPYLIDVVVRRTGGGADSTWHQAYSVAKTRSRKV